MGNAKQTVMVMSRREEFIVGPQNTEMSSAIAGRGFDVISHFGDICSPFGEQLPPDKNVIRIQTRSWLSYLAGRRLMTARTLEYLLRAALKILILKPIRIVSVCEYPLAAVLLARYPLERVAYYPLEVPEKGEGRFNIPYRLIRGVGGRLRFTVIPGEHRSKIFESDFGCRNPYIVYNSVSLKRRDTMAAHLPQDSLLRRKLPDHSAILYQGVLGKETSGALILDALTVLAQHFPVIIAGRTTDKECQEKLAAFEKLFPGSYVGKLPNHQLFHLRRAAAAGICLHNQKNSRVDDACTPNKYFDYVSSGIPVICSPNPALELWNSKYGTGVTMSEMTSSALVKAARAFMDDGSLRKEMSLRCQQEYKTKLNYEAQVKPFLDDFLHITE